MIKNKIIAGSIIGLTAVMPFMALAQAPSVPQLETVGGVTSFLDRIVNYLFGIFLVIAVIMIIYAAFLYLTAAGKEDQLNKAKTTIIYAVIAIVVAVVARSLVVLVRNIITQ